MCQKTDAGKQHQHESNLMKHANKFWQRIIFLAANRRPEHVATKGAEHEKYPGEMNDLENVIGTQINLHNTTKQESGNKKSLFSKWSKVRKVGMNQA